MQVGLIYDNALSFITRIIVYINNVKLQKQLENKVIKDNSLLNVEWLC